MTKIGIIFAMEKELELFASVTRNLQKQQIGHLTFYIGTINSKEVIALVSGTCKVNAALATYSLIFNFHPDLILNIGVSGGLSHSLQIGDVVMGENMVYHDVWCLEPSLYGQVQGLPAYFQSDTTLLKQFPEFKKGLLCTGDKFICTKEETDEIKKHFPTALAVDMESAAIAQTCFLNHVPCFVLRQISDTPSKHRADEYDTFWKNASQNAIKLFYKVLEKIS